MPELEIYCPMSARILTKGHIKLLEKLNKLGFVTVGLLTSEAMKGYKEELVPYEDRKYILETVAIALGRIEVVPQETLDPAPNIKKHGCNALASGDGFEPSELEAIKKLKLQKVEVTSGCKLHSSDILK